MKKITKQFICRTKTMFTETETIFTAIVKASYGKNFILKAESKQTERGVITRDNVAHLYFDTYEELKKEFEYQFGLCNNNLFTTYIKITK